MQVANSRKKKHNFAQHKHLVWIMAKTRLLFIVFSLVILSTQICIGQIQHHPGRLVLNNLDTLQGDLQDRDSESNSKKIWFRLKGTRKFTPYKPNEAVGFEMKGAPYVTRLLLVNGKQKQAFVCPLVLGRLNAFYFRDRTVYVNLDSGQLREIRFIKERDSPDNKHYRGLLKSYTIDCPTLNADTIGSTIQSLTQFVAEYNKCKGMLVKSYPITDTKGSWNFGFVIGQAFTSIALSSYDRLEPISFADTRSRHVGVAAHYKRSKSAYFYSTELSFQELNFLGLPTTDTGNDTFVQMHSRLLRLTIGINRSIPSNLATPYFGLGTLFSIPTKFEILTKRYQSQTRTFAEKNLILGIWGTLGVKASVHKKIKIFGEFRVEKSFGFGEITLYDGTNPLQLALVTGVLF